ncbi:MAG: 16S rRNA (guanine(527)-N(7))-methyltransferase RsmG [Gammaproteobacteria bacterium]|nr:16S rRNA (guanine(527)-N(7))-methyltransferase RsmG [Gammaproteobacteria bacterium]
MSTQHQLFHDGLAAMQLQLSSANEERLIAYLHLLKKWSKAYNLTAITDFDKMITHHLLDSLSIAPYLTGDNIVDVGSGAGLPGIPLAVYFPEKNFTLIDSVGKKTRFISQAVRELGLTNVTVLHSRAEDCENKHSFDTMIARAVASIDDLINISHYLLNEKGKLLMMKSDETVSDQHHVIKLCVPGIDSSRCLIVV